MTTVMVTLRLPGFHRWPEAPESVRYLAFEHRHLFTFRVECDVTHADRQVEFHLLQAASRRALDNLYGECPYRFSARSCEMIARELGDHLLLQRTPVSAVEVWEDDECGARVTW